MNELRGRLLRICGYANYKQHIRPIINLIEQDKLELSSCKKILSDLGMIHRKRRA